MSSQAHAILPYEDSFLIMGGLRCPPSECNECGCKRCQRSSAINKSVLLHVVGKSYSVHTSEEVEMSNITILALAHDKSNHFKGTMWAMDHGLKCQCHYQLPRHTQVPCMWRTFARKESEKKTSEIIANARLFWQNQSQE